MERSEEVEENYVLDTSVVIKWFSEEEETDEALKIRKAFLKGECNISVPDLQVYEVANALRYNDDLDENDVVKAVESLFDLGINIVVPTKEVAERAVKIALRHDLSVYDAYFVALANMLRFIMVTADDKLYKRLKKLDYVKLLKYL